MGQRAAKLGLDRARNSINGEAKSGAIEQPRSDLVAQPRDHRARRISHRRVSLRRDERGNARCSQRFVYRWQFAVQIGFDAFHAADYPTVRAITYASMPAGLERPAS